MALKNITLTRKLRSDAAASWKRMGKQGMPSSRLESAWRSESTQQRLYELWRAGKGNYALRPDQSNHVKGIAVDAHGPMQTWLVKNGAKHGWTRDKNEPWHFDYNPANDKVAADIRRAEAARKAAAAKAKARATARAKVKKIQGYLGVKKDGIPGPITNRAFDRVRNGTWALRQIQGVLGVKQDRIKGPKTEAAWDKLTQATK